MSQKLFVSYVIKTLLKRQIPPCGQVKLSSRTFGNRYYYFWLMDDQWVILFCGQPVGTADQYEHICTIPTFKHPPK